MSATYDVYSDVIQTVLTALRDDYNLGMDDDALAQLKQLWERKLAESGAVAVPNQPATTYGNEDVLADLDGLLAANGAGNYRPATATTAVIPLAAQPVASGAQSISAIPGSTTPRMLPTTATTTTTTTPSAAAGQKKRREKEDLDDEELNSEDDELSEDDVVATVETEIPPPNIVVSFYEKVQRVKTKYRVQLQAGVMHLNGKDHLFNKATGEFNW